MTASRAEITQKLKLFLEDEFPNQDATLDESTNLLEDWFVDSLGIIQTILFIEGTFGVEVPRAEINGVNFENISSLTRLIEGKLER